MTQPQPNDKMLPIEMGKQWRRLEVDGHFMGLVDIDAGVFCLYHRGKQVWYNLADMRREQDARQVCEIRNA